MFTTIITEYLIWLIYFTVKEDGMKIEEEFTKFPFRIQPEVANRMLPDTLN